MAYAMAQFFGPCPLGRDQKVKYHLFQLLSQFQIFFNQTVCVFSQMKYIKHIRRDFHSIDWVMPQRLDLGVQGVGGQNLFFSEVQPNLLCELLT